MRINFEVVKVVGTRTLVCEGGCGRRAARRKTFECTINPFNRNKDGTIKSREEVRAQAQAEANKWRPAPYTCTACGGHA